MEKTLGFCSFSSGSSGNSYLVCSKNAAIIIDAGISGRKIINGIEKCGFSKEDVMAVLLTHEHIDHSKSIKTLAKKLDNAQIFANRATWEILDIDSFENKKRTFMTGENLEIGDINVKSFKLSHDAADPCGFTFSKGDCKISIVTDTGCVNEEIASAISNSDVLVIEANHDTEILRMGEYPWSLKQRILSDIGHLSNEAAGYAVLEFMIKTEKLKPRIFLAHLSKKNNLPEIAFYTVRGILEENDYYLDRDFSMELLLKDEISEICWI